MIPDNLSSNDVSYQYTQGYHSVSPDHGFRQFFSHVAPPTIDPSLLLPPGISEPPVMQYDDPQMTLTIPANVNNFYQHPSPTPSTTTVDNWTVDYAGQETLPPAASPVSPASSSMDVTYSTPLDTCVCGCGRGPCIPQRVYERQRTDPLTEENLSEVILFSVNRKCGYSLADALKKQYTGLDGRDVRVFEGFKSSISLRLEWLPYDRWTKQIRTLTWRKEVTHITLAKLATEVAKRMKIFFEEMVAKPPNPSYHQYRAQPGVLDINHLELVCLKRVAKSSYMPHFRLCPPAQS